MLAEVVSITPGDRERLYAIDLKLLGDRIRRARLVKKITQKSLSKGLFTSAYLASIELGRVRPTIITLISLSHCLDEPIDYFLKEEGTSLESSKWGEIGSLYSWSKSLNSKFASPVPENVDLETYRFGSYLEKEKPTWTWNNAHPTTHFRNLLPKEVYENLPNPLPGKFFVAKESYEVFLDELLTQYIICLDNFQETLENPLQTSLSIANEYQRRVNRYSTAIYFVVLVFFVFHSIKAAVARIYEDLREKINSRITWKHEYHISVATFYNS